MAAICKQVILYSFEIFMPCKEMVSYTCMLNIVVMSFLSIELWIRIDNTLKTSISGLAFMDFSLFLHV